MEYDKSIIYSFLEQYEDFLDSDIESGYKNVYRPGWHPHPFQFWFNPPFDETGVSNPVLSGTIVLIEDGTIMVQSVRNGLFYNLDGCLGDSVESFILSLKNINQD